MLVVRDSSEDEMVAVFLSGEITSPRFGPALRSALAELGAPEELVVAPDLSDEQHNNVRRALLARTRGYGESRDVFDATFPSDVRWAVAELTDAELARVRYIEYSYWSELSGGTRLPTDAARRIRSGAHAFGVTNQRYLAAAAFIENGGQLPMLILVGAKSDNLVCLEGNLRLTAYALAGFPRRLTCLVGLAPTMDAWSR